MEKPTVGGFEPRFAPETDESEISLPVGGLETQNTPSFNPKVQSFVHKPYSWVDTPDLHPKFHRCTSLETKFGGEIMGKTALSKIEVREVPPGHLLGTSSLSDQSLGENRGP